MLQLIYFSNVSENTHRFINRLSVEAENRGNPIDSTRLPLLGETITTEEDYILIVPSYGTERTGHVPPQVKKFLTAETNRNHCVGVIGTGNINFGEEFAVAGNRLAQKLDVPLLYKFELSGFNKDIDMVYRLAELNRTLINEISERNKRKVAA